MFHGRPAAGYADLRTPVRGLYQAGSATHGGGGVTGIPGRNVVRQVLADRRAARWRQRVAAVRATGMASRPMRLAADVTTVGLTGSGLIGSRHRAGAADKVTAPSGGRRAGGTVCM